MKKLVLSLAATFIAIGLFAQPCVPDTSYNTPGIYPLNGTSNGFQVFMPDATVGIPYSEIVQVLIPSDTIIDTMGFQIPAQITAMRILNFAGLPPSINFDCNTDSCDWAGGENGCAVFHGTPSWPEVGTYNVDIVVYGTVSAGILGSLSDTIIFKMELKVVAAAGINEFLAVNTVKIAPNPFTENATLSFVAHKAKDYTLRLVDLTGRTVNTQTGQTEVGTNEVTIERNNLPAGMYFYSLEMDESSHAGRFIISQ